MSQLPALAEGTLPVVMAPDLDQALASLTNAMASGRTLPADRQLSPALRERLTIRADVLAGWLSAADPLRVRVHIGALLMVLPGQGSKGSVEDAERVQKLYVRALDGVPEFAVRAACAKALTRGVGGKKFAPSPAELRAEAEQEAHRWRAEAEKVRRVLEAKLEAPRPSDEVRRASAAAARRSFGIPEGGLTPGQVPHAQPDGAGSLAATARELFLGSSLDAWRRKQQAASGATCPEDRFDDGHADGAAA